MRTFQAQQRTDANGTLSLTIPLDDPDTEYDVVVVVEPKPVANRTQAGADAILERLRATGRSFSDSVELIREDRDR